MWQKNVTNATVWRGFGWEMFRDSFSSKRCISQDTTAIPGESIRPCPQAFPIAVSNFLYPPEKQKTRETRHARSWPKAKHSLLEWVAGDAARDP
jgi:hypothetical protein